MGTRAPTQRPSCRSCIYAKCHRIDCSAQIEPEQLPLAALLGPLAPHSLPVPDDELEDAAGGLTKAKAKALLRAQLLQFNALMVGEVVCVR